jgi:hypothetical protein
MSPRLRVPLTLRSVCTLAGTLELGRLQLGHAQAQLGVFGALQAALGDALLDQRDALVDLAQRHVGVADLDQASPSFGGPSASVARPATSAALAFSPSCLTARSRRRWWRPASGPVPRAPALKPWSAMRRPSAGRPACRRQLGHFHEVFGLGQQCRWPAQAHQVQRKAVGKARLARQAAQVGVPVVLLGVVGSSFSSVASSRRHCRCAAAHRPGAAGRLRRAGGRPARQPHGGAGVRGDGAVVAAGCSAGSSATA